MIKPRLWKVLLSYPFLGILISETLQIQKHSLTLRAQLSRALAQEDRLRAAEMAMEEDPLRPIKRIAKLI